MATTARTPPVGRLQGRPSAPQLTTARPVRTLHHHSRPDTPSFLDPNVSGVFSNLIHQATPTAPAGARLAPKPSAAAVQAPARKRQIEVVDLTQTDEPSWSAGPKRTKVEPLVMDPLGPPRRRQGQAQVVGPALGEKRDRQDHHDKLAEESAQWRAKYKKAFPSFVFYFDQLDSQTEQVLTKQVRQLGAVSHPRNKLRTKSVSLALNSKFAGDLADWYCARRPENAWVLFKGHHPRCHIAQRASGDNPSRQQGERHRRLTTTRLAPNSALGSTNQARFLSWASDLKAPNGGSRAGLVPVRRLAGHPPKGGRVWPQNLED